MKNSITLGKNPLWIYKNTSLQLTQLQFLLHTQQLVLI